MSQDTLTMRYGLIARVCFWFALGGSILFVLVFVAVAFLAPPADSRQWPALGLLIVGFAGAASYCLRVRHYLEDTFILSETALSRTDAAGRASTLPLGEIGAVRRNLFAGYFTIVSRDGAIRWRIY